MQTNRMVDWVNVKLQVGTTDQQQDRFSRKIISPMGTGTGRKCTMLSGDRARGKCVSCQVFGHGQRQSRIDTLCVMALLFN
jgi:hypothetical protein